MKPIPLFGEGINAYSPAVSAQRRLNCFYDVRKDGDKNTAILRATPGLALYLTLPQGPIRGMQVVEEILYAVAGNTLYSYDPVVGVINTLGTITTSSQGPVSMVNNFNQLGIVDGAGLWVYTLRTNVYKQVALNSAGSFGRVADANFPNGAMTLTVLNGYTFAESPESQFVYISAPTNSVDDMTNWTNISGLPNYVIKNDSPEDVFAVDELNGMVLVWGEQGLEFFQNVGSSPNPFARIVGATQSWGLAALWSRQKIDNTRIFLGQNPNGGIQIMKLDGYRPVRVSNSDVENIIANFPVYSDATSLSYMVDGHPMYQINFPTAQRTFLFDMLTGAWQEMQSGLGVTGKHIANLGAVNGQLNLVADDNSAYIYNFSTTTYTDYNQPVKRQLVSRHISNGGNLFHIDEVVLELETGVGLSSGQGSAPMIVMEVSKDGGRTFGQERWASMGAQGAYSVRAVWRRLGMARDFVLRFTVTDPVKFTVIRGDLTIHAAEGQNG